MLAGTNFEDALTAWREAEAQAVNDAGRAEAANGAGLACLKLRRYEEAALHLTRAVTFNPKLKVAWNNLGVCRLTAYRTGLSGTGAVDASVEAFGRVAELDAAHRPGNLIEARFLQQQERSWAAAAAGRTLTPRSPDATGTSASYRAAAEAAEQEADFPLAEANYERAEALATSKVGQASLANMRGLLALNKRRDPTAAVLHLTRATSLNLNSKFAWNNLGAALIRRFEAGGDLALLEEALAAFHRVAAIDAAYKPENLRWARGILTAYGVTVSATAFAAGDVSATVGK